MAVLSHLSDLKIAKRLYPMGRLVDATDAIDATDAAAPTPFAASTTNNQMMPLEL